MNKKIIIGILAFILVGGSFGFISYNVNISAEKPTEYQKRKILSEGYQKRAEKVGIDVDNVEISYPANQDKIMKNFDNNTELNKEIDSVKDLEDLKENYECFDIRMDEGYRDNIQLMTYGELLSLSDYIDFDPAIDENREFLVSTEVYPDGIYISDRVSYNESVTAIRYWDVETGDFMGEMLMKTKQMKEVIREQ